MFSKKPASNKDPLTIIDDGDKRTAFRYIFKKGNALSMGFKGKTVSLIDISAGGIAFKNLGFKKYDKDMISLELDIPNYSGDPVFSAQTRILHISDQDICHCIFENCIVDDYEIIHKYVLEMQKQDLRNK